MTCRLLRTYQQPSLSPMYEQAASLRKFFSKANRPTLYAGLWTRVGWSVLSCTMGIAFGSALLTRSYRKNNNYICLFHHTFRDHLFPVQLIWSNVVESPKLSKCIHAETPSVCLPYGRYH